MKRSLIHFSTFFLPIFLLFSCGDNTKAPQGKTANASVAVEGYVVSTTELSSSVQASGTLLPAEETIIYAELSGRIVSLQIPEGKAVKKGSLLVKLFDGDLQAQLKRTQAQISLAKETERRLSELLSVNGVARQEYDQSVMQLNVLLAEADIIGVSIAKTEIRAPFDGIVGLRQISEGAFVNPQTAICTIRSNKKLKLDFSVPEKHGNGIETGMQVNFQVDGDTTSYMANVIATEQSVASETRNLSIRAEVLGIGNSLLPGSFTEVFVPLTKRSDALMIPTQCVIPQARNKVVIVGRNGKAVFTPVKTGVRESDKIEITEGLMPGDTIATTGILFLRPNAPLTFSNAAALNK